MLHRVPVTWIQSVSSQRKATGGPLCALGARRHLPVTRTRGQAVRYTEATRWVGDRRLRRRLGGSVPVQNERSLRHSIALEEVPYRPNVVGRQRCRREQPVREPAAGRRVGISIGAGHDSPAGAIPVFGERQTTGAADAPHIIVRDGGHALEVVVSERAARGGTQPPIARPSSCHREWTEILTLVIGGEGSN